MRHGLKPTGRLLWVKLYGSIGWKKGETVKKFSPSGPLAVVDSPPAGLKPFPIDEKGRMENGVSAPIGRLGPVETRHGATYPLAAAAAAPFRYVVDPVLDVAGHAAFGAFYLIGAAISSPVWVPQEIISQRNSKQRD